MTDTNKPENLQRLSNDELVARLSHLAQQRGRLVAEPERIRRLPARKVKAAANAEDKPAAVTPASEACPSSPPTDSASSGSPATGTKPNRDKVEPLSVARFKVEFTADQELYDDIEKAKALLGPSMPRG